MALEQLLAELCECGSHPKWVQADRSAPMANLQEILVVIERGPGHTRITKADSLFRAPCPARPAPPNPKGPPTRYGGPMLPAERGGVDPRWVK